MDTTVLIQKAIDTIEKTNILLERLIALQQPAAVQAAAPAKEPVKAPAPSPKAEPADNDKDAILALLVSHRQQLTTANTIDRNRACSIVKKHCHNDRLAQCGSLKAVKACLADLRAAFPEAWK